MARTLWPSMASHQPDWSTGNCETCSRLWPCLIRQVFLESMFLGAPMALRSYLEDLAQDVPAGRRNQVFAWLP